MAGGTVGSLPRPQRWAGLSAIGAAALFLAANALWGLEQPDLDASAVQVIDFYTRSSERVVAGGLLSLVSIAIFVVFVAAFRGVLTALEGDNLLANIAFGGTLVGLAAGVGAETINMAAALRAQDGELSESLALALFDVSYVLGYNGAGLGLGLLAIATGAASLRAKALMPTWLAVVAIAIGVALLTPLSQYMLAPGFVLLLALGISLLRGPPAGTSPEV